MKKKHKKKHHRNNGGGGAASAAPSRSRGLRVPKRAAAPPWKTIGAAVIGGAGGAALGGLIVNQKILSPEAVGFGLMLGGGATAMYADGNARVIGTSIAAAGAGQFVLSFAAREALKRRTHAEANGSTAAPPTTQPAALPAPADAPPVDPPRRSAAYGGVVGDLFRDASTELNSIEEERWRYDLRDRDRDDRDDRDDDYGDDVLEIELDDAA